MKLVNHNTHLEYTIEPSDSNVVFCVVITDKDFLEKEEETFLKSLVFPRNCDIILSKEKTIEGLFTELGITKSKTDARNQNRSGKIEKGFTDIENVGKLKRNIIIWNNIE